MFHNTSIKLDNKKNEYHTSFNIKNYLRDIWNSFKCDTDNIENQLKVDFDRIDIYVNGTQILKIDDFLKLITPYKNVNNTFLGIRTDTLISMICNQASFGFPAEILYRLYGEIKTEKKKLHLAYNKKVSIHLSLLEHNINALLHTEFSIVDINNIKKYYNIPISVHLPILKNEEGLMHKNGFINWSVIPIEKKLKNE
jgi:hypothetical protein